MATNKNLFYFLLGYFQILANFTVQLLKRFILFTIRILYLGIFREIISAYEISFFAETISIFVSSFDNTY
jgi:hypothetical protein